MGRHILLIGIGQIGCNVAEQFSQKMSKDDITVRTFAVDTDEEILNKVNMSAPIPLVDYRCLDFVVDELGADNIKDWFPCDWEKDCSDFIKSLDMRHGANQWRMKAMLSFVSFLSKKERKEKFLEALNEFIDETELYVTASLAGGTGAGLFLPVTLYVKKYLESIGGKITYTGAALAMPSVCENYFSSEQKVKSYANAYSALRELNAVNLVTYDKAENKEGWDTPVSFRIGNEKETPEVVFDSEKEEYKTEKYKPFDKIYLFDRMPGVNSADVHADIIAETLALACRVGAAVSNDTSNLKSNAVFVGTSLVKVRYPIDSIIKYISKKQFSNFLNNELCNLHNKVTDEIRRTELELRTYGRRLTDKFSLYCEIVSEFSNDICGEFGANALLVRRNEEKDASFKSEDLFSANNAKKLNELIYKLFDCKASADISSAIAEGSFDDKDAPEKRGFSVKKQHFIETLEKIKILLDDYYENGIEVLSKAEDEFEALLLAEKGEPFSLLNDILKENGSYIHPVFALIKLCELYNATKKSISSEYELDIDIEGNEKIPSRLLLVSPMKKTKSKYGKAMEYRFLTCLRGETGAESEDRNFCKEQLSKMVRAIADDEKLLMSDFEYAYNAIKETMSDCLRRKAISFMAKLIAKYREVAIGMSRMIGDVESDLKFLALVDSTDGGNIVNIGASIYEKELMYQDYTEKYFSDCTNVAKVDAKIGEKTAETVILNVYGEFDRSKLENFAEDIENIFRNDLLCSKHYKENIDKNILKAIMDVFNDKEKSDITVSKVFMGRNIPLSVDISANYNDRKAVKDYTVAILPSCIEKYITDSISLPENETPKAFIERLMYNSGEYRGVAEFSDNINEKELFIRKDVSGLRLYMVNSVNELCPNCEGYASYLKALRVSKEQMTYMWDPSMVCNRGSKIPLPYINPVKQKQYEDAVMKAVLYAFMKGSIFTAEIEDAGNVYCIDSGDDKHPMLIDDVFVSEGELAKVILWAYKNVEWTELYSAKYDEFISQTRGKYPAFKSGTFTYNKDVAEAVKNSDLISGIFENVLEILKKFSESGSNTQKCVLGIAKTAYETVYSFCIGDAEIFDEVSSSVYNMLVCEFTEKLYEKLEEEKSASVLEWLNSLGLFMKYVFPCGFCMFNNNDQNEEIENTL